MEVNVKTAAMKLLKIAEALEKEASECTYFVCKECNHTATLASIKERRKKAAEEHDVKTIAPIQLEDVLSCPACQGDMCYTPTEESQRYYVEAAEGDMAPDFENQPPVQDTEEGESDEEGTPPAPPAPPAAPGEEQTPPPPEGEQESPFEPVDEQAKAEEKGEVEEEMKSKGTPEEEIDLSFGEEKEEDEAPKKEETPTGDDVEPMPPPEGTEDFQAPEDQAPSESEGEESDALVEEKDNEEDTDSEDDTDGEADDGEVEFPKEPVPKFKMPPQEKGRGKSKQASEAYWKSVARYSVG